MIFKPLQFKGLGLSYSNKSCFNDFNAFVPYGSRIAIIGRNGSGKSSFLRLINHELKPTSGEILIPKDNHIGYVPQIIEDFNHLSGAERFHAHLTQVLNINPTVLLLDEPTNHLDASQRNSLIRMLKNYSGTLIVASHDIQLIESVADILWHIDENTIHVFSGNYSNYMRERENERLSLEQEIAQLNVKKSRMHESLMQEQERAKKSKSQGRKNVDRRKWPTIVSKNKADRANKTAGQNKLKISQEKEKISLKLSSLRLQEIIVPKFSMTARNKGEQVLISISQGGLGYYDKLILKDINLNIRVRERIAILGKNASGKSTLIKGMMNDSSVIKTGHWNTIKKADIGYLDQHYTVLDPEKDPFSLIQEASPDGSPIKIRNYLSDFLFRKNEEVFLKIKNLSGGEKCRLCLAKMACQMPRLVILDEITNNIDLETREHVLKVFKDFPAALVVISHDLKFLTEIGVERAYEIENGRLLDNNRLFGPS